MSTAIVWFRFDLRLTDNPALFHACQEHEKVYPIYILADDYHNIIGQAQCWWLHHSLLSLAHNLNKINAQLILRHGDIAKLFNQLIKQTQADAVYWNRCYDPYTRKLDKSVEALLTKNNVAVHTYNASLLCEPWNNLKNDGGYYKVFTPFWKNTLANLAIRKLYKKPNNMPRVKRIATDKLEKWNLLPTKPNWACEFQNIWQPGEHGTSKCLKRFITHALNGYAKQRDFPLLGNDNHQTTSNLSPHLHFGEISPWQIWHSLQNILLSNTIPQFDIDKFFSQIGWREFSYYLLYHFPGLIDKNFNPKFNNYPWTTNKNHLRSWQQGKTGYPIVDAGMRELWYTGTMHNRIRMLVASFLTKDLIIDWREGEKWFWDTLLDADLANNSASWQWVAGTGADAAPYFRIFNPILQGKKFDSEGYYVKKWVPELKLLPKQYIHEPWQASSEILAKANIKLDIDYPSPIINHRIARENALLNYRQLS